MLNQQLSLIAQDDFDFLIKNGKRSSILLNFEFESLIYCKWGFLKEVLPDLWRKNDFENLLYLLFKDRGFNIFQNDIYNIELKHIVSFILWMMDELKTVRELESTYLVSEPDIKLLQAGINELDQFGIKNTLDNLAGGDILKYDSIRQLPYHEVFDKQYMETIKKKVEKKLAKQK